MARYIDTDLKHAILEALAAQPDLNPLHLRLVVQERGEPLPTTSWHRNLEDLVAHGLITRQGESLPASARARVDLVTGAIDAVLARRPLKAAERHVQRLRITEKGRLILLLQQVEQGIRQRNQDAVRRNIATLKTEIATIRPDQLEDAVA